MNIRRLIERLIHENFGFRRNSHRQVEPEDLERQHHELNLARTLGFSTGLTVEEFKQEFKQAAGPILIHVWWTMTSTPPSFLLAPAPDDQTIEAHMEEMGYDPADTAEELKNNELVGVYYGQSPEDALWAAVRDKPALRPYVEDLM